MFTGRILKITKGGFKLKSGIPEFTSRACTFTGGFRKLTKGTRKRPGIILKVANTTRKVFRAILIFTNAKLKVLRVFIEIKTNRA